MTVFTRNARALLLEAASLAEQVNGVNPTMGTELREAVFLAMVQAAEKADLAGQELRAECRRLAAQ